MTTLTEGWAKKGHWHFFMNNKSLCREHECSGDLVEHDPKKPETCRECRALHELFDVADAKHLHETVQFIRDQQTREQLSDAEMLRRFPDLGSTKTYIKILGGDYRQLDLMRWLVNYQQVREQIVALQMRGEDNEPLLDDLSTVMKVRAAFSDVMCEAGNNRLIIVQGPSGSGKTSAAKLLAKRFGARRIVFCEADETWKESLRSMMGGILNAFGVEKIPMQLRDCERKLIEKLRESRVCLVIDEAHHLGPRTLNLVKTIINQSPGEIILLAMQTLWYRLESQAYEEARQLRDNRLLERVQLDRLEQSDVEKILVKRLKWNDGDARKAAAVLRENAKDRGHLAFVKLVVRSAKRIAGDESVTLEIFTKAITRVTNNR